VASWAAIFGSGKADDLSGIHRGGIGRSEASIAKGCMNLYFNPQHEEFAPRTTWSLSNAFTSAFKEMDPIPQFKATAKLGEFLEARFSQAF
jgi:hypothetical protein